jgi:hypothetical protein
LVCLLTDLAVIRNQDDRTRDVERLAKRHEVRVLRRRVKRTAWQPGDRFVLADPSRRLPRAAWVVLPVRPETLVRWRWELLRRRWAAFGRRRGPGRPPLPEDVHDPASVGWRFANAISAGPPSTAALAWRPSGRLMARDAPSGRIPHEPTGLTETISYGQ